MVNSEGSSGGLLISLKKTELNFSLFESSTHWLWCRRSVANEGLINFVNIYGPHDLEVKENFWLEIRKIVETVEKEPLCLIGDFNNIRIKEDRAGCMYNNRDTISFNMLMQDYGFLEIDGSNYKSTWFGPCNRRSKLDRIIVNDMWFKLGN